MPIAAIANIFLLILLSLFISAHICVFIVGFSLQRSARQIINFSINGVTTSFRWAVLLLPKGA